MISRYDKFLQNPRTRHEIIPALVERDQIRVSPDALRVEFEDDIEKGRELLFAQVRV